VVGGVTILIVRHARARTLTPASDDAETVPESESEA